MAAGVDVGRPVILTCRFFHCKNCSDFSLSVNVMITCCHSAFYELVLDQIS